MANKKQAFQKIINDFIEKPLDGIVPRNYDIPVDIPKIISLLGPRRAGKTYMLFNIIHQLRKTIPSDRLVYINFEDDRFYPMRLEDMDDLLQGYYELYPDNRSKQVWFFFDEIQDVPNWEKFVRRVYDQENCRIYLTGSSSKLLSRELATALRGRTIPFEIFPLSFKEFLNFKNIKYKPTTSQGTVLLLHHLRNYLKQGGFPELIFLPPKVHNRVINEYIDLVLYRDLTERFSVRHPQLVKYLLKYLVASMSQNISVNKIFNDIKSQGYKASKNTLYDYVSYLEEAFVIFKADIYSRSVRKQAINPSKFYGIDPAFKYAMSIGEDYGRVFENAVFLELRRRGIHPNYFRNKQEVGFYWENGMLINACFEYDNERTKRREINGLLEAMDFLDEKESQLITWDKKEEFIIDTKKIIVRPLWEFLLDETLTK